MWGKKIVFLTGVQHSYLHSYTVPEGSGERVPCRCCPEHGPPDGPPPPARVLQHLLPHGVRAHALPLPVASPAAAAAAAGAQARARLGQQVQQLLVDGGTRRPRGGPAPAEGQLALRGEGKEKQERERGQ